MDELNTGTHCIQSTTQMFMFQRKSCCVRIQIVYWRFNAAYKEISIKLQETFLLRKGTYHRVKRNHSIQNVKVRPK